MLLKKSLFVVVYKYVVVMETHNFHGNDAIRTCTKFHLYTHVLLLES